MGSAVGGFMAGAGHAVTLVGRAAHMEAIADRGLRVTGIFGEHCFTGIDARTTADGLKRGDFDVVFITVKSYDTAAALEAAAPAVDEDTLVCAYQNGLGNIERIAARFGWKRTVGVRAIYGVRVTEPGAIAVTVIASPTALGAPRPEGPVERVRELAAAMDAAGLPTVYSDRVEALLWAKVAYNCALNPLSALLDAPYGKLPEIPEARRMMDTVIDELYAVGRARGVLLDPPDPDAYRELFYTRLVPPTAAHYASMHEDFARHRRTEIDALNGAIVRMGAESGVACPLNAWLTELIHAREAAMGNRPA
jgi:2-dehydropantoate 2-reductase